MKFTEVKIMFSLAAKTGAAGGNMWVMLVIYAAIFAVFYFVFIRPQNKKKKEEEKMRNNLQIGDEIITIGGFHAKVVSVKDIHKIICWISIYNIICKLI